MWVGCCILHIHHHTSQLPPLWILSGDIESHFILGNCLVARWEAGGNKKTYQPQIRDAAPNWLVACCSYSILSCWSSVWFVSSEMCNKWTIPCRLRKKGGKSQTKFHGAMHSQVIGFLGEALARMTAIQAMEEYGVSQYASSIQFINKLITADRWASILPCSFLFFAYMCLLVWEFYSMMLCPKWVPWSSYDV